MAEIEHWAADPYVANQPENVPFWAAAEKQELLGKRCRDCGKFHWVPRAICPFCGSANTEWQTLSGRGRLYAFSTLRRARPPYTVAYVELEEGPRVLTRLVNVDPAALAIDMAVHVVFERTPEGRNAPVFTP